MSEEKQQLIFIRGAIASMSETEQLRIKEVESKIRALLQEYEEDGLMALALIGAEQAAKD
jgi:hypothetical protein